MKRGLPTHFLGGDDYMWECPSSAIPTEAWVTVDFFWICYTRIPGLSGWGVQRVAYPHLGSPMEQDNWVMWAFAVIEAEFYRLQGDMQNERTRARELEQMHRQVQAEGRKR